MSRLLWLSVLSVLLLGTQPADAQVVETDPSRPRTDQSVTLYFNADEGNAGLEGYDGTIYAHTGISTDQNPEEQWKCVKNNWPTEEAFSGNRDDTQLTQVAGEPNRYRLEISDIRAYYQDTSTECGLGADEKIETMNMVFRNDDGSRSGRAAGGGDIFVDVFDVGDEPSLQATIQSPQSDPPLYPFVTQSTSVDVAVSADTANIASIASLQLFVDDTQVASTSEASLTYTLDTSSPGRFDVRVEAEATTDSTTLTDSTSTLFVRAPEVQDAPRPSSIQGAPGENDGITYNSDGSVTLSLYAPEKSFIYAIGDFSNWELDADYFMNRDGGHWWVTIPAADLRGQDEYDFQYFVDGTIRTSDPFAHKVRTPQDGGISEDIYSGLEPYPENQTENLVSVIRPDQESNSFDFSSFEPPEREDLVVYELLLRDFVEQGSFAVLSDTLDYLDRLGVNAVELMPVANFGGNNSWGYNPNAHLALDKSYGPPQGFKQFVEEAHQRGIAVIMDVVYNHITAQSPLSQLYASNTDNPFLEPQPGEDPNRDRGFCDDFFQELNHGSPFIKNYIDRANEYWLEEFNVDGFRFDLAKCVADDGVNVNDSGYQAAVTEGWKDVADHVWDTVDSDALMILEFFGSPGVENELGGYRDENTGSMITWYNMNSIYSQADMGYLGGDGGTSDFSSSYYENRSGYDQASFISYMESHDEQWLMRRKKAFGNSTDGYSTRNFETALNRQKLVGGFFFTTPGPRMMWQFGELGYGWGENECLKESDACTASDPGRTSPKPIRWEYRDPETSPDRVRLYKTWSALINLRQAHEVFRSPDTEVEMLVGDGERIRWIRLSHPTMDALVVGNFGLLQRNATVTFPQTGTWYNVFANREVNIQTATKTLPLRPGEFRVYTSGEPAVTPEEGLVPSTINPPSRIDVDVEQSFGPVTDPSNYRLVALPGSIDVPLTQAAFGTPGDTWRAFYDTGAGSDYLVEYSNADERFELGNGTGLWLLSERTFAYEDSVASVSLRKNRAHIPLHEGWNIISNPFSLSVPWTRVQADNSVSAPLYRWKNGSFVEADTFRTAATGEAFYFKNATGKDSLAVPYPGSVADRQAAQAAMPEAVTTLRSASTFQLQAQANGTTTSVRLGYSEGTEPVHHAAPRASFSDVRLVAGGDGHALATQVVPTAADSVRTDRLSYPLRLSASKGQSVTLRPKGLDAFTNQPVTLVNRATGTTYEVGDGETVEFTPASSTTRLQLRVGSVPDNESELTPEQVRLYQNYPNPVHRSTTIKYDLPKQASVRLSVYDVLGRRVTTLVRGERTSGQHTVTWRPGQSGASLSSGVYFVRLEADDAVRSRRITVVR
jgi:glycosidase